jgi:Flp pilus assembly pilin Flp
MYRLIGLIATLPARAWAAASVRLVPDRGQTLAEYAILLGVIALVVVAVAVLFGKSISSVFSSVSGRV